MEDSVNVFQMYSFILYKKAKQQLKKTFLWLSIPSHFPSFFFFLFLGSLFIQDNGPIITTPTISKRPQRKVLKSFGKTTTIANWLAFNLNLIVSTSLIGFWLIKNKRDSGDHFITISISIAGYFTILNKCWNSKGLQKENRIFNNLLNAK